MSWILQNKFIAILVAVTLVLAVILLYVGKKGSDRYDQALLDYQAASAQVSQYERLPLYPTQENLVGKTKALADYQVATEQLKEAFTQYQTEAPQRISPQEFGNRLVATHEEITSRLNDAGVELPAGFYSGFETYTTSLAQGEATAVLGLELGVVDSVLADLAAAKPSAILNFRRVRQPEEAGDAYEPKPGEIARPHAFELTFRGSAASARQFLSRLADTDERFAVIRTLRVTSESTNPPRSSDANFSSSAGVAAPAGQFDGGSAGGAFSTFDDLFGDDEEEENVAENDQEEPAPDPDPVPAPRTDGERILAQVAGNEEVFVFVRFDVMQFQPKEESPSEP